MKRLLLICLTVLTLSTVQGRALIVENELGEATVQMVESTLRVANASGETLKIYNVAGVCVMTVRVEGADKRYDLNLPKGCYIVKVGKVVKKISVR